MNEPLPPLCNECRYHVASADKPICMAVRDVVNGDLLKWECHDFRGDQLGCGVNGRYWKPIMPAHGFRGGRSA